MAFNKGHKLSIKVGVCSLLVFDDVEDGGVGVGVGLGFDSEDGSILDSDIDVNGTMPSFCFPSLVPYCL